MRVKPAQQAQPVELTNERHLTAAVQLYLSRLQKDTGGKIWFYKTAARPPSGSGSQKTGLPDYILCVPPDGKFIGLELKHPNGKGRLQDSQVIEFERIRVAGGIVHIATSLEQVQEIIKQHLEVRDNASDKQQNEYD